MREVSVSEIKKIHLALKNKKCHKALYSARKLKVIFDIVAGPISNTVNKSIQTSYFPNLLKSAPAVPIDKGGSTPVPLLPLLSNFFEKVVFNRLYIFERTIKY